MKKILFSLAVIGLIGGLVGGATWAYISDSAKAESISIASGNPDLKIYGYTFSADYEDSFLANLEWDNVYPGWSDSFDVKFKNNSSSPVGLDVIPSLERKVGSDNKLRDVITLQFISENKETEALTLLEWENNETVLEHLAYNTTGERWTLKFEFPETGENQNHLINSGPFSFDMVFDGIQAEAPITAITNIDKNKTYDTISNAVSDASANNTILVPQGTYTEDVTLNINGLALKFYSKYGGEAVIEGGFNLGSNANGVTVEGFKFVTDGDAIYLADNCPNDLIIKNNVFETDKMGVRRYPGVGEGPDGCPLENVIITGNMASGGDKNDTANQGIMILGELTGTTIVSDNYVEGKFVGINLGAGNTYGVKDHLELKNNTAVDCGQGSGEIAAWVDSLLVGNTNYEVSGNSPEAVIGNVSY